MFFGANSLEGFVFGAGLPAAGPLRGSAKYFCVFALANSLFRTLGYFRSRQRAVRDRTVGPIAIMGEQEHVGRIESRGGARRPLCKGLI